MCPNVVDSVVILAINNDFSFFTPISASREISYWGATSWWSTPQWHHQCSIGTILSTQYCWTFGNPLRITVAFYNNDLFCAATFSHRVKNYCTKSNQQYNPENISTFFVVLCLVVVISLVFCWYMWYIYSHLHGQGVAQAIKLMQGHSNDVDITQTNPALYCHISLQSCASAVGLCRRIEAIISQGD